MAKKSPDERLGHFLSLILRHDPSKAGILLDEEGFADVNELINGVSKHGYQIDLEILEKIVKENNKQRYSFNEDHTMIRANQGHSISVNLGLESKTPPDVLYHGTAARFIDSIKELGIAKRSRQYVHLSDDIKTAETVGSRHGKAVVLPIDTVSMVHDGHLFYLSKNGVWLCEHVPTKYIEF